MRNRTKPWVKKGRPFTERRLNNPKAGVMVVTKELKEILWSEKRENESLADCCLRLLRDKGQQAIAYRKRAEVLDARMAIHKSIED